jgi:hypothetical protein
MNLAKRKLAVAFTLAAFFADSVAAAPAAYKEPLDAQSLNTIKSQFSQLMDLANRHDLKALRHVLAISLDSSGCEERHSVRRQLGRILGE